MNKYQPQVALASGFQAFLRTACLFVACAILAPLPAAAAESATTPKHTTGAKNKKKNHAAASTDAKLSATDRMQSCDPGIAIAAAEEIAHDPNTQKEPLALFPVAMTLFQHGKKDEATFWYYVAQLRARYQLAFDKGNRKQLITVLSVTIGHVINSYAFADSPALSETLGKVLEWDQKTPNPYRDKPKSENAAKEIDQLYANFRELQKQLAANKDEFAATARTLAPEADRMLSRRTSSQCREPIDPSAIELQTQKEWGEVIDFVKTDKSIIQQTGVVEDTLPIASTRDSAEPLPHRYEVAVTGHDDKQLYAIVDVARIGNQVKYYLACTTPIPIGRRDPSKDACAQK